MSTTTDTNATLPVPGPFEYVEDIEGKSCSLRCGSLTIAYLCETPTLWYCKLDGSTHETIEALIDRAHRWLFEKAMQTPQGREMRAKIEKPQGEEGER